MRYLLLLTVLLAGALLAGCGADDPPAPATPPAMATAAAADATDTIRIVEFAYDPDPATVKAGQAISIPNADAAPHTITDAGAGKAFDSGTIEGRSSTTLTIDTPGTYRYVCEFHPFMRGEITVTK